MTSSRQQTNKKNGKVYLISSYLKGLNSLVKNLENHWYQHKQSHPTHTVKLSNVKRSSKKYKASKADFVSNSFELKSTTDTNAKMPANILQIARNGGSKERLNTSSDLLKSLPQIKHNLLRNQEAFDAYAQKQKLIEEDSSPLYSNVQHAGSRKSYCKWSHNE